MANDESGSTYLQQLEPYRSKGMRTLQRGEGEAGMFALYRLCHGSPTEAARFCGGNLHSQRKIIADAWTMMGLQVQKRNGWDNEDEPPNEGMTLDDWETQWIKQTSSIEKAPVFDWKMPAGEEYGTLVLISDLHYGSRCQDGPRWLRLRDWIAEHPNVRWVGLGDFLNTSTANSVSDADFLPHDVAYDLMIRHLKPIAKQGFIMLDGNHEGRIAKELKLRISPIRDAAKELGCDIHYGGRSRLCRFRLKSGKREQNYDGFLHHGFGGARTAGGKINKLRQTMEYLDVDFLAMGHVHDKIVSKQIRLKLADLGFSSGNHEWVEVQQSQRPMIYSGSFERYRADGYAQTAGMAPSALGSVSLHLYVGKHSVHAEKT